MKSLVYLVLLIGFLAIEDTYGRSPYKCSPLECVVNPCQFAVCEAYPEAKCRPNYCDCSADFFRNRRRVECDVCNQPIVTGPRFAKKKTIRWGFRDGECEEFEYGGKRGNRNNFLTKEECDLTCSGTAIPNILIN